MERNFGTAQDRLVKGMRVAGVKTLEQANQYLAEEYLIWWERELTVEAAHPDDAHRRMDPSHNLASSLSHVETRQIHNTNYTFQVDGAVYRIKRQGIVTGLRGAKVRVEKRLDGTMAVRYQERDLPFELCEPGLDAEPVKTKPKQRKSTRQTTKSGSNWNKSFDLKSAPPMWKAAQSSGGRKEEAD